MPAGLWGWLSGKQSWSFPVGYLQTKILSRNSSHSGFILLHIFSYSGFVSHVDTNKLF